MLLQITEPSANTILGLWQIEESVQELSSNISPEDLKTIESYHPNKQLEFLATRQLIRQVCEKHQITYHGIEKDEYGKPHLMDSTYHISVSHAFPLVGCLIHKKEPCGLDIEKPRPQLNRIKNKFLSKEELVRCGEDLELLCLHWSAKEALYKIYGRKQLIFAEELFVRSIEDQQLDCEVVTKDYHQSHTLAFFRQDGYFIVINV